MDLEAFRHRYRVIANESPATVAVDNAPRRFLRADEIGSSLADNKLLASAPIPATAVPDSDIRVLTAEQLAEECKKPLHLMAREALAMLGGTHYLLRTGQHDHKTFLRFLLGLEPKSVELNAGESLHALVLRAHELRNQPRDITNE